MVFEKKTSEGTDTITTWQDANGRRQESKHRVEFGVKVTELLSRCGQIICFVVVETRSICK